MKARYFLLISILAAIAVGFFLYRRASSLPDRIVIAGGRLDGRYYDLSNRLADEIRSRLGIEVEVLTTEGSLHNFHLLRDGEVDFAMYQPDTARQLEGEGSEKPEDAAFVANLYSEVLHVFVRRESDISDASKLVGHRVSLGPHESGDYATARMMLEHLGISEDDLESVHEDISYLALEKKIMGDEPKIEAACMSAGMQAPVFAKLSTDENIEIVPVPYARAFAQKHAPMWEFKIPAGYYRISPTPLPAKDTETVATRAKLLTRPNSSTTLVERLTEIILDEQFQRTNELAELFEMGKDFAAAKPEFKMHPGASHIYNPELKPLLNPDFVEGTEGIRSFVVSILIAGWLLTRWLRDRRIKNQEHRLDRYIRSLLEIERHQVGLDESYEVDDSSELQKLLDDVTHLRQEAMTEFSAHELNEDPSVVCFVQMCHALSDKINAKLTRQRLDYYFRGNTAFPDKAPNTRDEGN